MEGAGLLIPVAGRTGTGPFECVVTVTRAFPANPGIRPAGEIPVDGMDVRRDVRVDRRPCEAGESGDALADSSYLLLTLPGVPRPRRDEG